MMKTIDQIAKAQPLAQLSTLTPLMVNFKVEDMVLDTPFQYTLALARSWLDAYNSINQNEKKYAFVV